MMNNVVAFRFDQHPVRTVIDDLGEPWWVAKDICGVLGHAKPSMAVAGLDEDEVSKAYLVDARGCKQEMLIVSESGTYALIIRSNKPQAKLFRKWITSEVLPTIRKTGRYDQGGDGIDAIPAQVAAPVVSWEEYAELLKCKVALLETKLPKKMATRTHISAAEKTEILHLHSLGWSNSEIAKQTDRSTAAISYIIRGADVAEEVVA